jgi:hypothetical protein
VVLTYHSDSVLSSGVLMDSLSQSARIIGPDTGAFRDLSQLGLIDTFHDFPHLLELIRKNMDPDIQTRELEEMIGKFLRENSWESFAARLNQFIETQW